MTAVQKFFGVLFVTAVTSAFLYGMSRADWQFHAGMISGIAIIQCASRLVHGRWIDF